jgi:hypothetical protein
MPLPVYQNVVNLIVGFPIWRRSNKFVAVVNWEHVLLALIFLDMAKFTTLTPLLLLISCKLSLPIAGLKISSLPTLALKSLILYVFREFIEHKFQFFVEAVLDILCWA